MEQQVFSVTELNHLAKALLDAVPQLGHIYVRGEISNYKLYPSGHHYFSLKDQESSVSCVLFKWQAARLRFRPRNGMKVIALGQATVYPRDGAFQIRCEDLIAEGIGDLHMAFEQLKERLYREGLFDAAHKKPLPPFPRTVALVTSGSGKAVHDMIRILRQRYPAAKVKILPVRVQGPEAPPEIAGAIRYANVHRVADVIITGRGGGSAEDLWCFNDERVARAIYASQIPVITAVGHEPDVTIADFVADVSATTPTNAAQLAVPDMAELLEQVDVLRHRMARAESGRLDLLRKRLEALAAKRVLADPMAAVQAKAQRLDRAQRDLAHAMEHRLALPRRQLAGLTASLDAMSPLKVLSRGFAVATDSGGRILRRAEDVPPGSEISVRLASGRLGCRVEEVIAEEEKP